MNVPAPSSPYTILVVDDLEDNRDLLSQWLERHSYEVVTAASGQEAFERLAAGPIDLILLDIHMPKMDGFEFLRRLRGDEELRWVPVICVTAHFGEAAHIAHGLTYASGYFTKPFSSRDLLMKVEVVLQARRPTEASSRLPWDPPPEDAESA
ncbi:MAG: PleD family two-component system response regulator [Nitrospinota bacterium]